MGRTIEVAVTFVIEVPEDQLPTFDLAALEARIEDLQYPWFLNRVTQKDGKKMVTRMDFKRPVGV